LPITIPGGVKVDIDGQQVSVKGPKGELSHTVVEPIKVGLNDEGQIAVTRPDDEALNRSLHGLTRTLINNMVIGVTDGYSKKLELIGVGYRVKLNSPKQLEFALGFSHPVVVDAPEGITFDAETQTRFVVAGIDKQLVGEVAANIRKIRPPEPYKGKGVRYIGEHVRRKAGKAGK
jgi:large subunit ribosomal protein L6